MAPPKRTRAGTTSKASATTRAAIYCRLSLDKSGEKLGVARQEEACRELAERLGFDVAEVFTDNSISATKGKVRPGFEALLASRPEAVIVWHTDRLARVGKDLERVIALDVNVYGVASGTIDLSTSQGRMIARIGCAIAQGEGEQKGERQQLAARQRAESGKAWWPARAFGFNLNRTTGKVTLHRKEAPALAKAYEELLTGHSLLSIVERLNSAGHMTCRGNAWRAVTLRPVLLNARNAGIRVYDGEEVGKADWPAIVDEEVYRAAVHMLNAPTRASGNPQGPKPQNLLSGIARCGKCDGAMSVVRRGGAKDSPGSYAVYACRQGMCASCPVLEADAFVLARAVELILSPRRRDRMFKLAESSTKDAGKLRVEETALRARLDEIADMLADGELNRAQAARATAKAANRLGEIEQELAVIGNKGTLERFGNFIGGWEVYGELDGMSLEERRAVVSQVFDSIKLLPRGKGVNKVDGRNIVLGVHGKEYTANGSMPTGITVIIPEDRWPQNMPKAAKARRASK